MELTVLGMNGPFPAANGATSGYLVRGEKTRVAMDMGSGTLGRLTALMPPEKLDALLLSHWHFDHCSDVLPLLFRLQACAAKPLDVYAPVDESSMVRKVVQQNSAFCLHDVQKDDKVQLGEFSVRVFAARHPVPGVMYRVTDGEKTLCYTGDTNTVEGLTDFAQDADLLLADGLFPTEMWQGKQCVARKQRGVFPERLVAGGSAASVRGADGGTGARCSREEARYHPPESEHRPGNAAQTGAGDSHGRGAGAYRRNVSCLTREHGTHCCKPPSCPARHC